MSANEPRNPSEGQRAAPTLLSLETIAARLTMVEHCIVRSNADAADQIRELARLLGGVVEYLQANAPAPASTWAKPPLALPLELRDPKPSEPK